MSQEPLKLGSLNIRELPAPPFILIGIFLILAVATWIPLVVFARARVTKSDETRIHFTQDMDIQPKYKAQDPSEVFADGRTMRQPILGTVARGELSEDDHYERGFEQKVNAQSGKIEAMFFDSFPASVQIDDALLKRGQERFNIYCAVCHGRDGYGNGAINQRVIDRQDPTTHWVPPANLNSDSVRGRPVGHLFNTVSNGIRNMAGYGAQIPVPDRWAIVAYVRALQLSQHAPPSAVPPGEVGKMKQD